MSDIECQTEPTYDSIRNHKITIMGCDALVFYLKESEKMEWPLKDQIEEDQGQTFVSLWCQVRLALLQSIIH